MFLVNILLLDRFT